jgi:predicted RNase H-like HicB family nuclease
MIHYVAIVEEEEGKAVGVWFPDLPGCVSAGDSLDEAMTNAAEALTLWMDVALEHDQPIPAPRSLVDLKRDPDVSRELSQFMVALIPLRSQLDAAE